MEDEKGLVDFVDQAASAYRNIYDRLQKGQRVYRVDEVANQDFFFNGHFFVPADADYFQHISDLILDDFLQKINCPKRAKEMLRRRALIISARRDDDRPATKVEISDIVVARVNTIRFARDLHPEMAIALARDGYCLQAYDLVGISKLKNY